MSSRCERACIDSWVAVADYIGCAPAVVAGAAVFELVVQRLAVAAAGLAAEVVGGWEDAQEAHQAVQLACARLLRCEDMQHEAWGELVAFAGLDYMCAPSRHPGWWRAR